MKISASAASCTRLDDNVSTTDVAPILARRARRAGTGSLMMTSVAPAARATRVTAAPIGPAPATAMRCPDCYPRLAASPQSDRERLAKGARVIGDLVGQPEREIFVDRHVTGERAVDWRRGEEDHFPAQVVVTCAALPTRSARHAWLEGDTLSESHGAAQIPPADDDPGGLVAENHRCLDYKVPDPTVLVVVDV